MRVTYGLAALIGLALGRPSAEPLVKNEAAAAYYDQETGFTFSESRAAASLSSSITYRIAVPSNVSPGQPYDVVVQVVAPSSLGWVGLAWGGSMIRNPLTVGYPNGQSATVSSRWATGHSTPSAYTGATYTLLKSGNRVNGSHWQYTAKCTGCTTWTGTSGTTRIDPNSSRRMGYACSPQRVSSPSSNSSTIPVHDVYNYFTHDFSSGSNANFAELLARNGV